MNTEQNSNPKAPEMTKGEWFTLFLRVLGVWELIATFERAITIIDMNAGNWQPQSEADITHGLATLLIGISLLIAAPIIARVFYSGKPSQPVSARTLRASTAHVTRSRKDVARRHGRSHVANSQRI
jgi:hypothetical protein